MQKKPKLNFPKSFLWGATTSAHQVEGSNHNQWTVWEQENAKSLAMQAVHQYGDLDSWANNRRLATLPANYVSGRAIDHYNKYKDDFALLERLNMNAFRFSIEWSRVEPQEGAWDAEALAHYKEYVADLKKRGIEPILTLFHFTLPVWFAKKGGFEKRKNIQYFVRFAEKIMSELGSQVKYVITINEPNVYASECYYHGSWSPNIQNRRIMLQVLNNLAFAHKKVSRAVKNIQARAKVSVAYNSSYVYAGDDALLSRLSASILQWINDDYFLKKVKKHCDFLGVSYYSSSRVYGYRIHNPVGEVSDTGLDLAPENIEYTLMRLWDKYKLPILITGNGVADASDDLRQKWIAKTITSIQNALKKDVKVLGYMHYSLVDSFEWSCGRWPRYGLVAVDYRTLARSFRPSAVWFGKIIKHIRNK